MTDHEQGSLVNTQTKIASRNGPLRVGIGGPVGAGKTSLTEALCRYMAPRISMAVITNDIYTREDAEYLVRAQALPAERIRGVETGGCPHTAIREDASVNLAEVADLRAAIPDLDIILIESGGDNLAATFSPELVDLTIAPDLMQPEDADLVADLVKIAVKQAYQMAETEQARRMEELTGGLPLPPGFKMPF